MKIVPGSLVSLNVRLFDAQGELLEQTEQALVYLHGAGDIFPKVEQALAGHEAGYRASLHLEPEDAFGADDASLLHLVPLERLGQDVDLGMQFEGLPGAAPDGRIYRVVDLSDAVAVLDGNHPMAGRALRFDIEVVAVEPASETLQAAAERPPLPDFIEVGAHRAGPTRH
ncbi:MAG: peptidylprolyl isomerase [Burkholderiales bacterium]|jgi:FKBP-type peptidyl-prolyl cis-trans isomerase SlyD|nr:peptidylprolyl isomerase [Burkholderiales bacterium]MCA3229907.1 peptidylprolyl isomerase [Burkholderiales bacterium]